MYKPEFTRKSDGTPILSNIGIDHDAEEMLKDFYQFPALVPQKLDVRAFIEDYMGLLLYRASLTPDQSILGRMIFNDRRVPEYDPLHEEVLMKFELRGTILVEERLTVRDKSHRILRSTILHEAGHWIYHNELYTQRESEMPACRMKDIDDTGRHELVTQSDWLEHQVQYFSSAILMPRSVIFNMLRDPEVRNKAIWDRYYFVQSLSDIFDVSESMAWIRMENLGLYKNRIAVPGRF